MGKYTEWGIAEARWRGQRWSRAVPRRGGRPGMVAKKKMKSSPNGLLPARQDASEGVPRGKECVSR